MSNSADFISIGSSLVRQHLLFDGHEVTLIDAGCFSGLDSLAAALSQRGLGWTNVVRILLTHGHLDHTLRAAEIQKLTGAEVWAPRWDQDHIAGHHAYCGWSRGCGLLEAVGRRVFRYVPPRVDRWFGPDEIIPTWGSLRVVSLPGHTTGHSGFLSLAHSMLFSGDLFSDYLDSPQLPPRWFNTDLEQCRKSVCLATDLGVNGVVPNHGMIASPAHHRDNLRRLADRILTRWPLASSGR